MLKNDFFDFVLTHFDTPHAYIVGGAALWNYATKHKIADYALKDIDICILDPDYKIPDMQNAIIRKTEFATTFSFSWLPVPVQLLKIGRGMDILEVLDTFDLSLSRIAYHPGKPWIEAKTFACQPFEICACQDQLHTLSRVIKFVKRGFLFDVRSLVLAGLRGDDIGFEASLGES